MQGASGLPYIPTQASEVARSIDLLLLGLTLVTGFFSVAIAFSVIFFAVKYRRGAKVDRSNPQLYNLPIEIAWTSIPLVIAMGLFVWSTSIYLDLKTVPPGAMDVFVVGKQWMWKLQHPEGKWEMNELHVPVGRPVALTMTSEDVIHSFFIPELRVKQDVIPGQYTRLWFKSDKVGSYHLFCAQFCGTFHSTMVGTVTVMEPADYERWLSTGNYPAETLATAGERLFHKHGCSGCHGPASNVRAPRLEGIYNRLIAVQLPQPNVPLEQVQASTMVADQRYIHDSIVLPEKEVAAGFRPIMPSYRNRLTEEEIFALSAYIKGLGNTGETTSGTNNRTGPGGPTRSMTPDEYKARIGFIPENMKDLTKGAQQGGPSGPGGSQSIVVPAPGGAGARTNERMPR